MTPERPTPGEALEALKRLEAFFLADLANGDYLPKTIRADLETLRASLPAQPVDSSRCPSCKAAAWSRRDGAWHCHYCMTPFAATPPTDRKDNHGT